MLEGLVAVVPSHVPALRMLEQLHRGIGGARAARRRAPRRGRGLHLQPGPRGRALGAVRARGAARPGRHAGGARPPRRRGPARRRRARRHRAHRRQAHRRASTSRTPPRIATRARLVPAIKARRELARDTIARAIYQIEESMLVEAQSPDDAGAHARRPRRLPEPRSGSGRRASSPRAGWSGSPSASAIGRA